MAISSLRARMPTMAAGALGTEASCVLISISAMRALTSPSARISMVRTSRSSTVPNNSICSLLQPSDDSRNRSVTRRAVSRCFSAEPALIAASTSSTIDRCASSIARPERFEGQFWPAAECVGNN